VTIATALSRKAHGDRRLARVERELLAETNEINTTSGLLLFVGCPLRTLYFSPNDPRCPDLSRIETYPA